jgi:hypothetical protein
MELSRTTAGPLKVCGFNSDASFSALAWLIVVPESLKPPPASRVKAYVYLGCDPK